MKRAVVTRPEGEARRWVSALQDRGWQALALPLIVIGPPADPLPLRQARSSLADHDALMFVSAAAVAQFFFGQPWNEADTAARTRCWAPGPATARALRAAGVPPGRIDQPDAAAEHFDSESLWLEVGSQVAPGHRLLVVRGQSGAAVSPQGNGRDWLAQQCQARGGRVDWCVAYRRQAPDWGDEERAQAAAASQDGSVWLLSSSEALDHLAGLLPGADWSPARAIATHPRIAQAAARIGFGLIRESRPTLDDVLLHLESLS
jgi:uroporphyrinogen-III synthase